MIRLLRFIGNTATLALIDVYMRERDSAAFEFCCEVINGYVEDMVTYTPAQLVLNKFTLKMA